MKKQTIIIIAVVAVLLVAVAVFAILNSGAMKEKGALQESGTFFLVSGDQKITVTQADLEAIGIVDFDANYDPSDAGPSVRHFSGVPLKALFDYYALDYAQTSSITFTALDGYASALPIKDALDETSCYIAVAEDGAPIPPKAEGGSGPIMMVLAKDEFSQRWCKFLMEITLK